jgi:hypothetical protein
MSPTNKPFFPKLREVKKVITPTGEVFFSSLGAIPSVFVSFDLADSVKTPNFLRYLIAPGYVVSLNLRLSFDAGVWLALWMNEVYYALLIFLISTWFDHSTKSTPN